MDKSHTKGFDEYKIEHDWRSWRVGMRVLKEFGSAKVGLSEAHGAGPLHLLDKNLGRLHVHCPSERSRCYKKYVSC